jgi:glycosyltransferase involved in cell wall biosynthesis
VEIAFNKLEQATERRYQCGEVQPALGLFIFRGSTLEKKRFRMKILHVTKKYPPLIGGDAIVVQSLETEQKKLGHDVFILTSKTVRAEKLPNVYSFGLGERASTLDNVTVKRVISLLLLFFQCFFLLRRIKPTIIHTHSPDLGFACALVARLHRIPVVHTCHGVTFADTRYSRLKRATEKFFLKHGAFSAIVTVDKTSLQAFHDAGIERVIYIPNGVDTAFFKPIPRNKGEIVTFLFVGRLENQKGLIYLIEAVKLLASSRKVFQVTIVGDGSLSGALQSQVRAYHLENFIFFVGAKGKTDLREYYQHADVLILPSLWEGFPLTILEAWASGVAVIATKVNGIPAICTDSINALLVSKENPQELFAAMELLLDNRSLVESLGQQGRILANKCFSWQAITEQTLKVYDRLRSER